MTSADTRAAGGAVDMVWYSRRAGEMDSGRSSVRVVTDDGPVVTITGDLRIPKRVVLPNMPSMGEWAGRDVAVSDWAAMACPHPDCQAEPHTVTWFAFEAPFVCVECPRRGFLWAAL